MFVCHKNLTDVISCQTFNLKDRHCSPPHSLVLWIVIVKLSTLWYTAYLHQGHCRCSFKTKYSSKNQCWYVFTNCLPRMPVFSWIISAKGIMFLLARLSVSNFKENYWMALHENFTRSVVWSKEDTIQFWFSLKFCLDEKKSQSFF